MNGHAQGDALPPECRQAREQLPLYLYGELTFDEEESAESHLEQCAGCRAEEARLSDLHRMLNDDALEPSLELLSQCRQDLRAQVAAVAAVERPWWRRWSPFEVPALVWKPAAALALVAVGFITARFTPVVSADAPAAPYLTVVSQVVPEQDGSVSLVVDETRRRVMAGDPEEPAIRAMLLAAARNPSDPGVRVESVDLLKERCQREEVRQALVRSLESDPNDAVRLRALEGLKPYAGEPGVRSALSRVLLSSSSAAVRTQAMDLLLAGQPEESELAGLLQELMQREENGYIRQRSQSVLRAMNASLETF